MYKNVIYLMTGVKNHQNQLLDGVYNSYQQGTAYLGANLNNVKFVKYMKYFVRIMSEKKTFLNL